MSGSAPARETGAQHQRSEEVVDATHLSGCNCGGCRPETVAKKNDSSATNGGVTGAPTKSRRGSTGHADPQAPASAVSNPVPDSQPSSFTPAARIPQGASVLVEHSHSSPANSAYLSSGRDSTYVAALTNPAVGLSSSTFRAQSSPLEIASGTSVTSSFNTTSLASALDMRPVQNNPIALNEPRYSGTVSIQTGQEPNLGSTPSISIRPATADISVATTSEPRQIETQIRANDTTPAMRDSSQKSSYDRTTENPARSIKQSTPSRDTPPTSMQEARQVRPAHTNHDGIITATTSGSVTRSPALTHNESRSGDLRINKIATEQAAPGQRQERFMGWASERSKIASERIPNTPSIPTIIPASSITETRKILDSGSRAAIGSVKPIEGVPQRTAQNRTSTEAYEYRQGVHIATDPRRSTSQNRVQQQNSDYAPRSLDRTTRDGASVYVERRSQPGADTTITRDRSITVDRQGLVRNREPRALETGSAPRQVSKVNVGDSRTGKTAQRSVSDMSERAPVVRSKTKEVRIPRDAAMRSAILERLNRVVSNALKARRLGSSSSTAMQQLELATRVLEALNEEEYEGISEFRSADRAGAASLRSVRSGRKKKQPAIDDKKSKLKGLKALKKQRKIRVSAKSGVSGSSGAAQNVSTAGASAASPATSTAGKISNASNRSPGKSLDIFQAKVNDDLPNEDDHESSSY